MATVKLSEDKAPLTEHAGHLRSRRLSQALSSAVVSKGVVLLVNAATIPIVVRYLGAESFGLWTTITSALTMLIVMDLGVANSLMNFISEAYARDDRESASRDSTTALLVMCGISSLLGLLLWMVWGHLDWSKFLHVSGAIAPQTVSHVLAVAFVIFLIGLPASLAGKILGGYQELKTVNIFVAAGSLCNLLSVIVLVRIHAGLTALVAASSSALVAANVVCLVWIFVWHKPWLSPRRHHINGAAARRLMQSGSEFFIWQIAGWLIYNTDNLIVSHYLGPAEVTPYSVAWKLVGYASIVQTLLAPALWPAFSEAFARNDMAWVRKTFKRTMILTMGTSFAAVTAFAVFGRLAIRIWASRAAVPTEGLLLLMCFWIIINTFLANTSTILVAKGEMKLQAWLSFATAIVNVGLSIFLVQRIGLNGVILGTIISYLLVYAGPQIWKTMQVLYRGTPQAVILP